MSKAEELVAEMIRHAQAADSASDVIYTALQKITPDAVAELRKAIIDLGVEVWLADDQTQRLTEFRNAVGNLFGRMTAEMDPMVSQIKSINANLEMTKAERARRITRRSI